MRQVRCLRPPGSDSGGHGMWRTKRACVRSGDGIWRCAGGLRLQGGRVWPWLLPGGGCHRRGVAARGLDRGVYHRGVRLLLALSDIYQLVGAADGAAAHHPDGAVHSHRHSRASPVANPLFPPHHASPSPPATYPTPPDQAKRRWPPLLRIAPPSPQKQTPVWSRKSSDAEYRRLVQRQHMRVYIPCTVEY